MKSTEIRNGIYYSWRGSDAPDEGYVQRFGITDWTEYMHYPERFRPVPITEDWLIKFGFIKQKTETGPPINAVWDEWIEQYEGLSITNDTNGHWFLCNYSFNQRHFKYVHQLQNLFFALTGEELKIKEDGRKND